MNRLHRLFAALLAVLALQLAPAARAATMTDMWWNPSESGWGANVVQQQDFMFMTIYAYGQNNQPVWYTAPAMTQFTSTPSLIVFTGSLYVTTGPWQGGAFNPSQVFVRSVGTVTFSATTPYTATLTYSVDGVTVNKAIQRYSFRHISLAGNYVGSTDVLSSTTCALSGDLMQPFATSHTLNAAVNPNGATGTFSMTINDGTSTATFTGNFTQYGIIYDVLGTLTLSGVPYTAQIYDMAADDDGIRGNIVAQAPSGCVLRMRFAAVRPG